MQKRAERVGKKPTATFILDDRVGLNQGVEYTSNACLGLHENREVYSKYKVTITLFSTYVGKYVIALILIALTGRQFCQKERNIAFSLHFFFTSNSKQTQNCRLFDKI